MITDSYDISSPPVVTLEAFYGEKQHICDICIVTFSKKIHDEILSTFDCRKIAEIGAANGAVPIYMFEYKGKNIAFYLSMIGAPTTGSCVIESNHLIGASKYIMFGSSGSLNSSATDGKYVIPTEAYRDEGMSYHFAPPADYIAIKNSDKMTAIFDELGIPYVKGRVWTTDSMTRETRKLVSDRQSEGCIAVDMELSGVQAVCDFHGIELYDFLFTGDVLDLPEYDAKELHAVTHDFQHFMTALQIVEKI